MGPARRRRVGHDGDVVKRSAGLLVHRERDGRREVLLVHPGGPFWAKRDDGAWSVPKGELDDADADGLATARREFREELGIDAPAGDPRPLGEVRLKSGKRVEAWAVAGDVDVDSIVSNTFETEWPPKSGRVQAFPEVDRAGWFALDEARVKLNPAQCAFLDRLGDTLG
jgi:predicted NUDIX family NTP pyrophosphohydrolase